MGCSIEIARTRLFLATCSVTAAFASSTTGPKKPGRKQSVPKAADHAASAESPIKELFRNKLKQAVKEAVLYRNKFSNTFFSRFHFVFLGRRQVEL